MSLYIRTAITCDAEPCKEMVTDDDRHARQIAKRQGWVRVRRGGVLVDLCPAHKGGGRS